MTHRAMAALALVLAAGTRTARPQEAVPRHPMAGATVAWVRLQDPWPAPGLTLGGWLAGVLAEVPVWRLDLRARYTEGTLRQSSGGAAWTLVDGEAGLGYAPVPWVSLSAGPCARTYLTPNGSFRRTYWQGSVTLGGALVEGVARAYGGVTRAVSSRLNTGEAFQAGWGGEAGLEIFLPGSVSVRMAYRLDSGLVGAERDRESREQVLLGAAIGRP